MPDSIRSATVRLEAQVASYIADMKAAGKATDEAFKNSSVSAKRLDKDIEGVSTRTQDLAKRTSTLEGDFAGARREADKLATSVQRVGAATSRTSGTQTKLSQDVDRVEQSMRRGGKGLDSYTDRLSLLVSTIGAVGPALGPVGAIGIGGLAGLANDAGAAAVAGGSLIVAFQGVGKALAAVDKAAINPTTANLEAAKLQMEQLSPAAQHFVTTLHGLMPLLHQVQASAASGWFPGLTEALHELKPLAPVIGRIFHDVGQMGGDLLAKGAASLAGDRWRPFFTFIDQQAPRAMAALGKVVASLTHGLAEMWMAFSPVNNSFNQWLVNAARSFDRWASGLSKTQGFHDFVAYLQENGPKVAQAVGAIARALVQIVQAAAPLGGPTLQAITGIANAIAAIADSPLGTPILMIVQLASAMRLLKAAMGGIGSARGELGGLALIGPTLDRALPSMARFKGGVADMRRSWVELGTVGDLGASMTRFGKGLRGSLAEVGKAAAPIAAVALATSGVTDKMGLTNTATLALAGSMAGPLGTAAGATVGFALDLKSAFGQAGAQVKATNDAIKSGNLDQITQQLNTLTAAQAEYLKANQGGTAHGFWDGVSQAFGEMKYAVSHPFAHDMSGQINQLTVAQSQAEAAAERLRVKQLGLSRSFVQAAHEAGTTGSAFAALTAQTNALKDATLGAFSAETTYREALVAAEKQAKNNNAGIKGMSAAALKNREDLATLADAWNKNIDAMRSTGTSIDVMDNRFVQARAAFIKTATAMGVPIQKARELAADLLHIPSKVSTVVHLSGADAARTAVAQLRQDLSTPIIQQVKVVHNGKTYTGPGNGGGGQHNLNQLLGGTGADGTSVPKDGRAYGDRYLYMLAPGEEVISNRHGQADQFRADRAAGRIPGYANGGTVDGPVATYSRTTVRTSTQDMGWRHLRDELKATTKELEKEKNARSALVDKMHQLSTNVQDNLRSDLFSGTSNPWTSTYGGTSPAGVMGTLRGDNANIRSEIAAIKALKAKGVTGDALATILAQGGLEGAKAFAALPSKDLAAYERLFNQRAHLLSTVGSLAGSAAYGGRLSEESKEIRTLNATVKRLEAEVKRANKQAHEDRKNHTQSQQRGAASAGRKNARNA